MSKTNAFNYKAWFDVAASGNTKQLLAWNKAGDLKKAYDPSLVAAIMPAGRPRAQHFVDQIYNDTALHCALRNYQYEYAAALMKLFAWPPQFNKKGETALHLVADCIACEKGEDLTKAKQLFTDLIKAGYSPVDHPNEKENFIKRLMKNIREDSDVLDVLKMSIDLGTSFDYEDLRRAILLRQYQIVDVFLVSDASCASPHQSGENPLHIVAAIWDPPDGDLHSSLRHIMRSLVAAGVDHQAQMHEPSGVVSSMKDFFRKTDGHHVLLEVVHEVEAEKIAEKTPNASGSMRAIRL